MDDKKNRIGVTEACEILIFNINFYYFDNIYC